jgi:hypothetical protein
MSVHAVDHYRQTTQKIKGIIDLLRSLNRLAYGEIAAERKSRSESVRIVKATLLMYGRLSVVLWHM